MIDDDKDDSEVYNIEKNVRSFEYEVTLSEEIESPVYKYQSLCTFLREEVKEEDTVIFQISNYGGSCDSAAAIVNAMMDCKGRIKCCVNSASYSAATMIALAGDELELKRFSFLMFHNFSYTTRGKGGELKADIANTERNIHSMMSYLYEGFLTKQEIKDLFNDKDTYVHWNDKNLAERLANKFGEEE